jgi:hypothetical protein
MKSEPTKFDEIPTGSFALTRLELLELKLDLRVIRIRHLWRKYWEDQPRVPAGSPDGGQWLSTGDGRTPDPTVDPMGLFDLGDALGGDLTGDFQDDVEDAPVQVAQNGPFRWTPGRVTSRITGRMMEGTSAQITQFAVTNAQAEAATREVWRIEPNWRPPSGLSETIEGEIRDAEVRLEAATTRLRELGDPAIREVATRTCLMPNGDWVGFQNIKYKENLRTVSRIEFNEILGNLSSGSRSIPSRSNYRGLEFQRTDGTVWGVRASKNSDVTIDILETVDPLIPAKTKVHFK